MEKIVIIKLLISLLSQCAINLQIFIDLVYIVYKYSFPQKNRLTCLLLSM